jgi:hypothetical protein
VTVASHILLAQQGIRLLRQAPRSYPNGGSRLKLSTILVELHDFVKPTITNTIIDRFHATHDVILVTSRRKNLSDWPVLEGLSPADMELAVAEHRPVVPRPMQWAVLRPNHSDN